MTSVGALIVAGAYNASGHVHSSALLIGTDYGRVLIVKWALLLPMLALGAVNRYGLLPLLWAYTGRIKKDFLTRKVTEWMKPLFRHRTSLDLERRFLRLVMIEAILGLGVLACSAYMTQLSPPHQISTAVKLPYM
jgi:putative copper export protein